MEQRTDEIKATASVGLERFVELPLSCIETNLLSRRSEPEENGGGLKESIHRQGLIHPVTSQTYWYVTDDCLKEKTM